MLVRDHDLGAKHHDRTRRALWIKGRMARRPRLQYAGAIYHVMARGNRKNQIFEDDRDRRRFIEILSKVLERYGAICLAYCLMDNHYHLVLQTPRSNLSDSMRQLNGVYTQWTNRRHKRTGHVFEGRFVSLLVESADYLRELSRYVVANPVRAHLVQDPSVWQWSSYRVTAGLETTSVVSVDWLEQVFGGGSLQGAQARFRLFVNDALSNSSPMDLTGPVVGTKAFQESVRRSSVDPLVMHAVPRSHRAIARPRLEELFTHVGASLERRDTVIQRAHVVFGYRLAEISAFLGLHPTSASKAVKRLENKMRAG